MSPLKDQFIENFQHAAQVSNRSIILKYILVPFFVDWYDL